MKHPADKLIEKFFELGGEDGLGKMFEDAKAEIAENFDQSIPESVELKFDDGSNDASSFRNYAIEQEAARKVFDKMCEGIDFEEKD